MRFPAPGFIEIRGMMMGDIHNFLQGQTAKNYCLAIKDITMITNADSARSLWVMLRNGAVLQTEEDSFQANHPQDSVNALAFLMKAIDSHLKTTWTLK